MTQAVVVFFRLLVVEEVEEGVGRAVAAEKDAFECAHHAVEAHFVLYEHASIAVK